MKTEKYKYAKIYDNKITVSNEPLWLICRDNYFEDVTLEISNGLLTFTALSNELGYANYEYVDKLDHKPHKDYIKREFLTKREYVNHWYRLEELKPYRAVFSHFKIEYK